MGTVGKWVCCTSGWYCWRSFLYTTLYSSLMCCRSSFLSLMRTLSLCFRSVVWYRLVVPTPWIWIVVFHRNSRQERPMCCCCFCQTLPGFLLWFCWWLFLSTLVILNACSHCFQNVSLDHSSVWFLFLLLSCFQLFGSFGRKGSILKTDFWWKLLEFRYRFASVGFVYPCIGLCCLRPSRQ